MSLPRRYAACLALALSAAYFAASWRFTGPAYLNDEVGYLLNAAALTGDRIDGANSYHFGYSLLLAPAFLLADQPGAIWRLAQATNALLGGASVFAFFLLAERFAPAAPLWERLGSVLLCAASPILFIMAGYSFPTPAFVLVYALCVLALLESASRPWLLLVHGALVGFLFWVHPLGAAVIVASLIAMSLLARGTRAWAPVIGAAAIEVAAVLAYRLWLSPALVDVMTPDGFPALLHYNDVRLVLSPMVLWETFVRAAGQIVYLVIATLGFALLGAVAATRQAITGRLPQDRAACAFMVLSVLGIAAAGALMFSLLDGVDRTDQWMYGRYVEGAALPLLLFGLLAPQKRILAAACLLLSAAFLALLWLTPGTFMLDRAEVWWGMNPVNALGFWPAAVAKGIPFYVAFLIGALGAAIALLLPKPVAGVCVAAAFLGAGFVQAQWHLHALAKLSHPSSLPDIVRDGWVPGSCVAIDPKMSSGDGSYWRANLYKFHLHDYDIRRMPVDAWRTGCDGPLITDKFSTAREAGLIAREMEVDLMLAAKGSPALPSTLVGVYLPHHRCTQSEFCFRQDADDLNVRTQVGRLKRNQLLTTGQAGYLFYGPGTPLKAGTYHLTLDANTPLPAGSYLDVIEGTTDVSTIARLDLEGGGRDLDFVLPKDVSAFQVRLFATAPAQIGVSGYVLSRQPID